MKFLSLIALSLALFPTLAPAAANRMEVRQLECRLMNLGGVADFQVDEAGQRLVTPLGETSIESLSAYSLGRMLKIDVIYRSVARQGAEVPFSLLLVPSLVPAFGGPQYQGALFSPVYATALLPPGPFSGMTPSSLSPFGGMTPAAVPVGYLSWAAAFCSIELNDR